MKNLFFLKEISELEREVVTPEMEEYDLCIEWDEEGECVESVKAMRKVGEEVDQEEYNAYVFNFTRKESYNFCTEWTYDGFDDEGNPIQLVEPQCVAFEVRNHDVPYTMELDAVKVGRYDSKDVIHVVATDPWMFLALQTDPDYIGDSYSALDANVLEEVMEVTYDVEEEGQPVRKRAKKKKWKDDGEPGVKKAENVPHKFAGVSVE